MPLAGNGFLKSGPFTIAYHQNNENMKTLIDAKNNQVDLFLSWCWPAGITLNSDLALKDDIQESDQFTSGIVAELVAHLEPRYHFCAGNAPKYYEREPFKSQGKMTRFIGLGAAESGAKAMYALVLKPFDQEESKGISTTPSPFSSSQKRPRQEEEFHESSFFWNNDGASFKKAKANDVPPDGYICKICKNPGHYVHKCPENKTSLPEGYLCRICGTPGHHIRDCPQADSQPRSNTGQSKHLKKRDLTKCWFCLSNPQVESHMILGIIEETYIALAKGAICDDHVLVVPIVHFASTKALRDGGVEESTHKEIQDIYQNICKIQKKKENFVVQFEIYGGGDPSNPAVRLHHLHVNMIPLPISLKPTLVQEFDRQASHQGLVKIPDVPGNVSWPFVRIKVDPQQDWITYSPPVPKPGAPAIPFNINFARFVLARVMEMPDRVNWKQCVMDQDQETEITNKLRDLYHDMCT